MKTLVSSLAAVCVAVVAALVLGWLGNGLNPGLAWISLGIGGVAGSATFWSAVTCYRFRFRAGSCRPAPPAATSKAVTSYRTPKGCLEWSVIVLFALFALRVFCWLLFVKGDELAFLSPNNLGDLSLHLTHIRNLASGVSFWPQNPIFAGSPLHYPFGVDLFNSLLHSVGVDDIRGLVWVGLLGSAATGLALWRWGGAFALAGFLFNGGVAGFVFLKTGHFADYQSAMEWKSLPLALFVTQRGLLYALPVGLTLLWSWRARFLRGERGLPFWLETLFYATLPLFHLHTFLFLSWLLGCWLLLPCRRAVLMQIAAAFLPATVLVWQLTGGLHGSGLHWQPGWMQGESNALVFWFENFGFLPLAVALLLFENRRCREKLAVALPAVALFLVTCFVSFAAWEWDNTKLMLWCYLAVLPGIGELLRRWPFSLRTAACCALFFSGFVSLVGGINGTHHGYTLASRRELDTLSFALRTIPPGAVFAAQPTYNHPLLLLGRQVVAGYEGHLFSHGIDCQPRLAQLEKLFNGTPDWKEAAQQLNAQYLYWGPREQAAHPNSPRPWATTAAVIQQDTWGTIYKLR